MKVALTLSDWSFVYLRNVKSIRSSVSTNGTRNYIFECLDDSGKKKTLKYESIKSMEIKDL